VCALGEEGKGPTYRTICRSIAVDPDDGSAYFTDSEGTIHHYRSASDAMEIVRGDDLRKDYFGLYDPTSPGHMGYNWRQVVWVPSQRMVYGVHGNSGYLFRFDPRAERVEVLDRITSLPSQRAGMFDQFSYGYLGFTLGPDGRTLYYLTGGPVYVAGKRVAGKAKTAMGESKGIEDLHLVTYDVPSGHFVDHGAIVFADGQRPSYVNSIAVGRDGTVYALSRITEGGKTRTDLMSIPASLTLSSLKCVGGCYSHPSVPGRAGDGCISRAPSTMFCRTLIPRCNVNQPGRPSALRFMWPPSRPTAKMTSRPGFKTRPSRRDSRVRSNPSSPDCSAGASGFNQARSRRSSNRNVTTLIRAIAAYSRAAVSNCNRSAPIPVFQPL
jgi:hypothetical protein